MFCGLDSAGNGCQSPLILSPLAQSPTIHDPLDPPGGRAGHGPRDSLHPGAAEAVAAACRGLVSRPARLFQDCVRRPSPSRRCGVKGDRSGGAWKLVNLLRGPALNSCLCGGSGTGRDLEDPFGWNKGRKYQFQALAREMDALADQLDVEGGDDDDDEEDD